MNSKLNDYSKEELQNLIDNSRSLKEVLEKIGLSAIGNNYKTLHNYMEKNNINTSQLDANRKELFKTNSFKYSNKEILLDSLENDCCRLSSSNLLDKLIFFGIKEYKCEVCGITEWNNKPIRLELHHKDGNHNKNKLDNLQVLCPNCHSQTNNFRYKNKRDYKKNKKEEVPTMITKNGYIAFYKPNHHMASKDGYVYKHILVAEQMLGRELKKEEKVIHKNGIKKDNFESNLVIKYNKTNKKPKNILCPVCGKNIVTSNRASMCQECYNKQKAKNVPPKEELEKLIYDKNNSFCSIGRMYGVTDNAVRKWCKKYNLPYRTKDLKNNQI